MALVDRVRNICISPATEWPIIEQERPAPSELVTSYLLPLAALGAAAGFLGRSVVGLTVPVVGAYRTPIVTSLVASCAGIVFTVIGCYLIGFIINALAPTFGARQDANQAFKTSVYSFTPGLVAAVLAILPVLGSLVSVIAGFYGLFLLYVGLPITMKAPADKTVAYTVVIVVCAIVLSVVVMLVTSAVAGVGTLGSRML